MRAVDIIRKKRDGAQLTPIERAQAAIASGDPDDARIILERAGF